MFGFWLLITLFLIIIEVITVNLITIWYIISGILTIFLSLAIDNFYLQFGMFVIVGTILLIVTKPIIKKITSKKKQNINIDRILGMKGKVTEKILKNEIGEVKVDGKKWSAIADYDIDVGSDVKVLKIESTRIKVERMEE